MRIITYSTKINRENNLTELVKEKAYNYKTENKHLDCAEKIASMICDLFELHTAAEEYVYLLSLDTKCRILGIFEVAISLLRGDIKTVVESFLSLRKPGFVKLWVAVVPAI
mgnify:CR=1 FL=1